MKVDIYNQKAEVIGETDLPEDIFSAELNKETVSFVVRWQMAKKRAGVACTKGRSEVAGSKKKPWAQKGTGRARAGTVTSPVWRGGGVTFGPKPRDYSFAVPKKVRASALRQVLSDKVKENAFVVVDTLQFDSPKTKNFKEVVSAFKKEGKKVLVVDADTSNTNLYLSLRNLTGVNMLPAVGLNVYDVMYHDTLLCTQKGLESIQARFK